MKKYTIVISLLFLFYISIYAQSIVLLSTLNAGVVMKTIPEDSDSMLKFLSDNASIVATEDWTEIMDNNPSSFFVISSKRIQRE